MVKFKILIPVIGFIALAGMGTVEGQQAAPPEKTIIEVKGSKSEAIKILQSRGVSAVELKGAAYTLPQVQVTAPSQVDLGDMIVVSADLDRSKFPDGLQQVKYQWTVLEDGKLKPNTIVWPDGSRIFFAAGMRPKTYQVILDVDALFGVPQSSGGVASLSDAQIDSPPLAVTTIQVGDTPTPDPNPPAPNPNPVPVPVPVPTPTPTPPPVFPVGKYGLSDFSYQLFNTAAGLTQAERYLVASNLAVSFESTAAKIAALSTMRDTNSIMADIKSGNDAAFITSNIDKAKLVAVKTSLGDKIYNLYSTQAIVSPDDFQAAFREIALGLKAVTK